jgi:hypothetical protein
VRCCAAAGLAFAALDERTDNFIAKPISIKQIRNKVNAGRCALVMLGGVTPSDMELADPSFEAFRADWQLMITNAVTYNEPTSNVARDAYHMLATVGASNAVELLVYRLRAA